MKKYRVYFFLTFFALSLVLGGCYDEAASGQIPELLEPVAANGAYRPVELGVIGETRVLYGTVVPVEYCCFYDTTVGIKEIAVEIGDWVDKGDVIAYADIERAKEELSNLQKELENLNQNYSLNNRMEELRIEEVREREVLVQDVSGNLIPQADVSGNMIDMIDEEATQKLFKEREIELGILWENYRYAGLLYEYRVKKKQEEIAKQEEIIAEGTLRASESGYVVYVKSMGVSTYASPYENIVVIADPAKTYIELTDRTTDKYTYKDYEVKYLRLAGKEYGVTEVTFGTDIEILAKANGKYPNVRLTCPEAENLETGETYPIFFKEKDLGEVPIIGLDSLEGEKDAYYVYVKSEDGERQKRTVKIGEADNYYAHVLSGLELGEEVYYESDSRMPDDFTEYTVALSDYRIENCTRSYSLADEQTIWYDAGWSGTIKEIAVESGQDVEKGDLLYVLNSDAGNAAFTEAQSNINQENLSYAKTLKDLNKSYEKTKDKKEKQLISLQIELETVNHVYRLNQLEEIYNDMAVNNNGSGEIRVYAKESGRVGGISVKERESVIKGSHVLALGRKKDDLLLVKMVEKKGETSYPKNIADIGESVTITIGENAYSGICVGRTCNLNTNSSKQYVTETKRSAAISFCTDSGYIEPAFYVEMEEDFYQNEGKGKVTFSYVFMEDVIVIPTALITEETNAKNPARTDYFVWRIVGDELVKQYVMINKAYSDVNTTVILSGVEVGDVLAREK